VRLTAEDRASMMDVLSRYCHLIDEGEPARLADDVFASDAELDYGAAPVVGADAIRAFFSRSSSDGSAHFVSTFAVRSEAEEVRTTCYYQGWVWSKDTAVFGPLRPVDLVTVGAYDDAWTKTPQGWRIRHRRLRPLGPGPVGLGRPPQQLADMLAERARRAAEAKA